MPKYRVGLYFNFRVDYEVEAADDEAAREAAHRLNEMDSDPDLVTQATEAIELVDSTVEEIS